MPIYVVTGLGFGDEVKGGTTQWLCRSKRARTVVRTGGPQAFHSVVTRRGKDHAFSQFGSGTFEGAKTFLSKHMLIEPYKLVNEGQNLIDFGEEDAFDRLTIDENALVITPFQAIASRLREIARGANRHGTVGLGVGETILDSEQIGDLAVRVKDFGKSYLSQKLEAIRQLKLKELAETIAFLEGQGLSEGAKLDIANLKTDKVVYSAVEQFDYVATIANIVDSSYLESILKKETQVVFEASQGVLLDRWHGFHPHTTKVNPTSTDALALIHELGFSDRVIRLGVIRGYHTRHGAGPFVTYDEDLTQKLPDVHNSANEWQGDFRIGWHDAVALRYAIACLGGSLAFDGLVVTCLDRLAQFSNWKICDSYIPSQEIPREVLEQFFEMSGDLIMGIKVRPNTQDNEHLEYQERLGQLLRKSKPRYALNDLDHDNTFEEKCQIFLRDMERWQNVPVVLTSFGPTELDKKERVPVNENLKRRSIS